PELTRKWWKLGARLQQLKDEGPRSFVEFWAEAMRQSPYGKAFREVLLQVRQLMNTQVQPAAAELDGPVLRIREICAEHGLGDVLMLIEFRSFTWEFYGHSRSLEETFH